MMGSPEGESQRRDDEILHQVVLTQGYWLADTACTQALWQVVMGNNPSCFKDADRPLENVNWLEVTDFLARLNQVDAELQLCLPTEAQWEYACRAGSTSAFSFGHTISPKQVNYDGDFPYAGGTKGQDRGETLAVKSLPMNPWALYEMHGNVWEWCSDWAGGYPSGDAKDPTGPDEGEHRVVRGGSWIDRAQFVRSAHRSRNSLENRQGSIGFRLARGQ